MFALLHSLGMFIVDFSKSRHRLEAENFFLRRQLPAKFGVNPATVQRISHPFVEASAA